MGKPQGGGEDVGDGVTGEIPLKPQHIAVGHGGGPHELTTGVVIVGAGQSLGQLGDNGAHHSGAHLAAEGALLALVEVALKGVGKDIHSAGGGLPGRQGEGEGRVHQGEAGAGQRLFQSYL